MSCKGHSITLIFRALVSHCSFERSEYKSTYSLLRPNFNSNKVCLFWNARSVSNSGIPDSFNLQLTIRTRGNFLFCVSASTIFCVLSLFILSKSELGSQIGLFDRALDRVNAKI